MKINLKQYSVRLIGEKIQQSKLEFKNHQQYGLDRYGDKPIKKVSIYDLKDQRNKENTSKPSAL